MIFLCPTCAQSFRTGDDTAGKKVLCPKCGQKILVPTPPPPAPVPSNKTTLGKLVEEEPDSATPATSSPLPQVKKPIDEGLILVSPHLPQPAAKREPPPPEQERPRRGSRDEEDEEDERDRRARKRRRLREEDDEDYDRRRRRGGRWRCPYCDSRAAPRLRSEISTGGWVVFVVLLLFFFPLCWIGLLMTEQHRTCFDCGARIG